MLGVVDDDPDGVGVGLAVLGGCELGMMAGRTVTGGESSSGVSDPTVADRSDAMKVDVVAAAGAVALR